MNGVTQNFLEKIIKFYGARKYNTLTLNQSILLLLFASQTNPNFILCILYVPKRFPRSA